MLFCLEISPELFESFGLSPSVTPMHLFAHTAGEVITVAETMLSAALTLPVRLVPDRVGMVTAVAETSGDWTSLRAGTLHRVC